MKPFVNKIEIAIITAKTHQVSRCLEEGDTLLYMSCLSCLMCIHGGRTREPIRVGADLHERMDNVDLLGERAAGEVGVEG